MPKAQRLVAVSFPLDCSVSRKKSSHLCFESGALTTLKHQLDAQMLRTQKKEMLVLLVCLLPYTYHFCCDTSSQRHLKGRELLPRNMSLPELLQ